jgi:Domain of unknown function (DUF1833)
MLGAVSNQVWLTTLTVSHASWVTPFYFVNDNVDHTVGAVTFIGLPFDVRMPSDSADETPRASLVLDNVSKTIIDELRALNTSPTYTLAVRLASSMSTIEWGPITLQSGLVDYDQMSIYISLSAPSLQDEPYPSMRMGPSKWRGLAT